VAQKLTILNGPNNGAASRKKAKKAKRDLKQFATTNDQTNFNGLNNGQQINKLRDMVLALIDQNTNLTKRVEDLEAAVKSL
jgi:hypothetical protein